MRKKLLEGNYSKVTIIKPPSGLSLPDFRAFWHSRGLLVALVVSDLRSRHRQTIMGFAWNFIQPVIAMIVFTVLFGKLGSFKSEGLPYPLFFFSAFLIWQFFQKAVGTSVPSLAANSHLIAKVYFPRLIILVAPIATATIELGFSCVVLASLYAYYGILPPPQIVLAPLLVIATGLAALSISSWLAPLNVFFRDVQVVLPSVLQLGFFITPVVFSTSALSETWRSIAYLNPMATIVELSRWMLAGSLPPPIVGIATSAAVIIVLLVLGLVLFQRAAQTMVDRL